MTSWPTLGGGQWRRQRGASQRSMPRQWPERTVMEDRAQPYGALGSRTTCQTAGRHPAPSPHLPVWTWRPRADPKGSPEHLRPKGVTLGRLGPQKRTCKPSRSRMAYVSSKLLSPGLLGEIAVGKHLPSHPGTWPHSCLREARAKWEMGVRRSGQTGSSPKSGFTS